MAKSRIVRHDKPGEHAADFPPAQLTTVQMEAIGAHIEKYVGKHDDVLHEIISEGIHLDVIPIEPSKKNRARTFVTMGMSARPMKVPSRQIANRAELCVVLPEEWPTDQKSLSAPGEKNYWPIRGLKDVARLPSNFDTFLSPGHTVPNGDPPEPFAKSCQFACWMVIPPVAFADEFAILKLPRFTVSFMQIIPLYREEMEEVLKNGPDSLFARFAEGGLEVERMCDPARPNTCAKVTRKTKH